MAAMKLSAKATESVEFLEHVLRECDQLAREVEEFASAKKNADMYSAHIARELSQMRQRAMIKSLPFVADAAGGLSVQASRGASQSTKTRAMREGLVAFRGLVERTIKQTTTADGADRAEKKAADEAGH
mgnify:FL=1